MSKQVNSFLQSFTPQEVESAVETQLEELGEVPNTNHEHQADEVVEEQEVEKEEVVVNAEEGVPEEETEYFSFYEDGGEEQPSGETVVEPVKVKDKVKVSLKDYVEQYQE